MAVNMTNQNGKDESLLIFEEDYGMITNGKWFHFLQKNNLLK
jgi:hypothetical protein